MSLVDEYEHRLETVLIPLAGSLEAFLKHHLSGVHRIDRITARAKRVDRFLDKAEKKVDGRPKYRDPLNEIQDQVGARIVTFYLSDVEIVATEVRKVLHPIEDRDVTPESESEFGYVGKHFIFLVPADVIDEAHDADTPKVFELQIKTLFQHAWSEAEHDLGYKPSTPLSSNQRRRLAFTAAQAWGADEIFDELHRQTGVETEAVRT